MIVYFSDLDIAPATYSVRLGSVSRFLQIFVKFLVKVVHFLDRVAALAQGARIVVHGPRLDTVYVEIVANVARQSDD